MTIDTIWPCFLLVTAVLAFIALPAFRFVEATPQISARYATIDGLRGFLAFSVFIFHLVITRRFIDTGAWRPPDSWFYDLLGPFGVSLFFMITGFLFWTKLLIARGRGNWRGLYEGRVLRIGPMYLFTVLMMLLVVFARTGFALREPPGTVLVAVGQWLALGFFNWQPDVNGYPATRVLAGVTWTISYEWAFYVSLLATAYFARGRAHLSWTVAALITCLIVKAVTRGAAFGFAALFLLGMTVASLLHEGVKPRWSDRTQSSLALLLLLTFFGAASLGIVRSGYGTLAALLLAGFFYLICAGTTLFGLLLTRPARRLGHISYSIYLLQGLVLTLVFAIPDLRAYALSGGAQYWLAGLACSCVLVLVSACTYYWIELPPMRLSHARALKRRALSAAAAASPSDGLAAAEKQLIAP